MKIPVIRWLPPVVILVFLVTACRRDAASTAETVPAEFVDGIILVRAVFGGTPGLWLLDSGYEYSLLDSTLAASAGIAVSPPVQVAVPGGVVTQGWARSVNLDIGSQRHVADSIGVLPLQHLAPIVGRPIAGVLGHDFFEHFVVGIDYGAHSLALARPEQVMVPDRAVIVPVAIESGEPFVVATLWVNGRTVPAKLKLDTGSLSGLGLNGSFVAQTRLFPDDWPRLPVEGIAMGGATRNFVGRLDSIGLGGVVMPGPVVGWSEDLTRVGDAGTIGAPLLARFRVTFDYPRRRILIVPADGPSGPEMWDASGMLLAQVPDDDLIVAIVLPGTPADSAGIRPGDVLERIGGTEATAMGLERARQHFRHPGRRDSLHFTRNGRERSVELTQRALLP